MISATLSSHVLDLARGRPAAGLAAELWSIATASAGDGAAQRLAAARTDDDGRIGRWDPEVTLDSGVYELLFFTGEWFAGRGEHCFYPEVRVRFEIDDAASHYHVPLLLNRFGYSTYRGS